MSNTITYIKQHINTIEKKIEAKKLMDLIENLEMETYDAYWSKDQKAMKHKSICAQSAIVLLLERYRPYLSDSQQKTYFCKCKGMQGYYSL